MTYPYGPLGEPRNKPRPVSEMPVDKTDKLTAA